MATTHRLKLPCASNTYKPTPPPPKLTREQRSLGGKISAIKRKERKEIKEDLENFLRTVDPTSEEGFTFQERIVRSVVKKAIETGNIAAFLGIQQALGQKPVEVQQVNTNITQRSVTRVVIDIPEQEALFNEQELASLKDCKVKDNERIRALAEGCKEK